MSITSPTKNQNVTGPAQGQGLHCAGNWIEEREREVRPGVITTKTIVHKNESLVISLTQPGVADQSLYTKTDGQSNWSVGFSSCRPGPAKVEMKRPQGPVLGDFPASVAFNIAPNVRGAIDVKLNGSPADGAHCSVKINGSFIPIEAKIDSPTSRI